MAKVISIKRSPAIVIRNLIVLEFAATGAYFLIAFIADYGQIYRTFTFSQFLSYEIAKLLFIMLAQAFLMVFMMLRWFFQTYSVYPDMIVHEWGILFKQRKIISLPCPFTISCHFSPLAKIFKYGTLIFKGEKSKKSAVLTYVPNPEKRVKEILNQQTASAYENPGETTYGIEELLFHKEHQRLEFKTSFRWDARANKINKSLEKTVMKTISAFLNTDGGHLVIGVDDNGRAIGLQDDYATLRKKNSDGFENHFTNLLNDVIGPEFMQSIKFSFHNIDKKEICLVRVLPSAKPAYAKLEDGEAFFIRTGNSTTPLRLSKATSYIRSRWKD